MESDWLIIVSTTTRTGQALARKRFGATRVFWYPLDFAFAVRACLRALRPELVVLMESEIWPRMLMECNRRGIPIAVVNARVSDRSYRRTLRVRAVWRHLLRQVSLFLAQNDEDGRRLVALGARPEAVRVAGNLKYDVRAPRESRVAALLRTAAGSRPVVVAGSTVDGRPLSEEQILLQSMRTVWQSAPEVLLILAPRHPERFAAVVDLASRFGPTVRATQILAAPPPATLREKIVVLDTIGDLAAVYSIARAAFVGGSLVERGGHNPLEPAQFGVPVVMGPSFSNFRAIVEEMRQADGIWIVKDQFQCHEALLALVNQTGPQAGLGHRGRQVFEQESGSTGRIVEALLSMVQA